MIQKIKAEIERLKAEQVQYSDIYGSVDDYARASMCEGMVSTLSHLLSFIESLEKEQPEIDFEKEIDIFLYGSDNPERYPETMQARDEHTGLRVNDWKCWVNRPEYRIEFARHFYELGLNARKEICIES